MGDADTSQQWILGTASFGSHYGVTNETSLDGNQIDEVLNIAKSNGWAGLDTAPSYPNVENILGMAGTSPLQVFTKVSKGTTPQSLGAAVAKSMSRLDVSCLHGLTLHSTKDFLQNPLRYLSVLDSLKNMGLIKSWGISVYSPQEVQEVMDFGLPDYIQAPVNILDRRFLSEPVVDLVRNQGIRLQARSVFLQGVLTGSSELLPKYFNKWKSNLMCAELKYLEAGFTIKDVALSFVRNQSAVASLVIGVNSAAQIDELSRMKASPPLDVPDHLLIEIDDNRLIDPRNWKA